MPKEVCVIGFDFGMKKIGIAVGQTLTQTSTPLTIIPAKDGIPNWDQIADILAEWHPHAIIVGLPLNMDGTEQHLTFCAKKFGNRLHERFKLPVHFVDERLSSIEAKNRISQDFGGKALEKKALDAVSAQIILEDWLNNHTL